MDIPKAIQEAIQTVAGGAPLRESRPIAFPDLGLVS